MSSNPYSRHDPINSHAPLTSDAPPSFRKINRYADLTQGGRSPYEEPGTLDKVDQFYQKEDGIQEMVVQWLEEAPSQDDSNQPSNPLLQRSVTSSPPSFMPSQSSSTLLPFTSTMLPSPLQLSSLSTTSPIPSIFGLEEMAIAHKKRSAPQDGFEPNSEEALSNEDLSLKKRRFSSREQASTVSVFDAFSQKTREKTDFINEVQKLIFADSTIDTLRNKAQEFGKEQKIAHIDKQYIQELLIWQACTYGHGSWQSCKEIVLLNYAQRLGLKFPDPLQYETDAEKNGLLHYLGSLSSCLKTRTNPINKGEDINHGHGAWVGKTELILSNLKTKISELQKKIKILTSPLHRDRCFSNRLTNFKVKWGKDDPKWVKDKVSAILKNEPRSPLQKIAKCLIDPSNLQESPFKYLKALWEKNQILMCQSNDKRIDAEVHEEFCEPLLNKEIELRRAAGATPDEIEDIIEEMTRLLQTTPTTT